MIEPWYVTGFCDGEAAFTYSRSGGAFNLYFSLFQRADNHDIVERIQEFFGYIGTIYVSKGTEGRGFKQKPSIFPIRDYRATPKEIYTSRGTYYRVTKVAELKRIINHFDKYPLQGKKQGAYLCWRKMAMHKIENYRDTDYDNLRALAAELASLNQKSRAFKTHKK